MKVYITQGHEQGIGLEVLFKSLLMLNPDDIGNFQLIAYRDTIAQTLESLKLPFKFGIDDLHFLDLKINLCTPRFTDYSQSFSALKTAMKFAEKGGVLYTLPTSKDQFPGDAGHTEFFRRHYKCQDLGMFFSSPSLQVLLLSDHVPVRQLSKSLTEELIFKRTLTALKTLSSWNWPVGRVLISGLNPHAGEMGLIGDEDERVRSAIKRLREILKNEIAGPFPGDTMLLEKKSSLDLLIYLFHDQGLGIFKGLQGFIGSNITLGLPYPRFSPDHGTSFSLYGKNQADYRGCEYSLRQTLHMIRKGINGQNSSYKGKSS